MFRNRLSKKISHLNSHAHVDSFVFLLTFVNLIHFVKFSILSLLLVWDHYNLGFCKIVYLFEYAYEASWTSLDDLNIIALEGSHLHTFHIYSLILQC